MQASQQNQFFSMLTGVCELYGKTASPQLMALYWSLLQGYDLADVQRAFGQHAMNPDTGQYMPKPADVVRYIDGGSQSRAALAWQKVEKAMRTVGGGDSVVFDDPVIHATLGVLGQWPEFCKTEMSELHFLQSRFIKQYQAFCVNTPADYPRLMVGRYQAENTRSGFHSAPPVLIGDAGKCRQTYLAGVDSCVRIGAVAEVARAQLEAKAA